MADGIMNIVKGRALEFWHRVANNDPANSAFVIVLLESAEADAVLVDYDDLGTLLAAGGNTECAFTNYARETLTDADVSAPSPDDANDRQTGDLPDVTWTSAGGAVNETTAKLLLCYDSDTTAGTDSNILVISHFDFVETTNGTDLVARWDSEGVYRAS